MRKKNRKQEPLWGMIIYEHLPHCLTAVWTHNRVKFRGEICGGEVLEKIEGDPLKMVGTYKAIWNETDDPKPHTSTLLVEDRNKIYYDFKWIGKGGDFVGKGMLIGDKVVVIYWKASQPVDFSKI